MNYSDNFKKIISKAKEVANKKIINGDIFIGILFVSDSKANKIFNLLVGDENHAKYEQLFLDKLYIQNNTTEKISISIETENVLAQCQLEANKFNSDIIRSEHLLLSLSKTGYFNEFKYQDVEKIINNNKQNIMNAEYENTNSEQTNNEKIQTKGNTPMLDQFSTDLTKMAKEGKLDPVVGRIREIRRLVQILSRRRKNNPVIIGDSGCVDENTLITIRKFSNETEHNIIIVKK